MALLACICAASVFLYGVFLLEAVAHAAARTSAQRHIREINAQLGTLEAQYLSQTQVLTPAKAQELGFVAPLSISTVFVSTARSLSLRGQ